MNRAAVRFLYGALCVCALVPRVHAQTPIELIERGFAVYHQLDFDAAAGLIRSGLAAGAGDVLTPDQHAEALTTLGAAEVFRGNPGLARNAFRDLVIAFPFYEIDRLVFPPEVTSLFSRVRQATPVARIVAPVGEHRIEVGRDAYEVTLLANTDHEVSAVITRGDGRLVQNLFTGRIGDSLVLRWDGRDTTGALLRTGPYVLRVRSGLSSDRWERVTQLPLDVDVRLADTLSISRTAPDSLLRPELRTSAPGMEALVGGVLTGVAIAVIPASAASGSELNGTRFVVAGAVGIAGIVGFFKQRSGTPIPGNVSYNQDVRAAWQDSVRVIDRLNMTRQRASELRIRAGRPSTAEIGRE